MTTLSRTDKKTVKILALLAAALSLAALTGALAWNRAASADNMPMGGAMPAHMGSSQLACLDGPSFDLKATDGRIDMPDGNSIYVWGFAEAAAQEAQFPGPTLCVTEGDTVSINLTNELAEDVSMVFPGQEGVQANGQPAQPQFDGSGNLVSMADTAAANGGTVTYTFTAGEPGTYLYESGTDPNKQVQMGLHGALVVRPAGHAHQAYHAASTAFSSEYLMLFAEIDPMLHKAVERGRAYDATKFHPRYWTINGRAFPDTLAPNDASYLPNQPYGAMVSVRANDDTHQQAPALIRYLNAGRDPHPMHPHGNHVRLVAHDGALLQDASGADLSREEFTQNIGPGQTWDGLFKWTDLEKWSPTNPIPVLMPQNRNLAFGDMSMWSGSPYLGEQGSLPPDVKAHNECGEYYFIAHSHAAYEMQNWDQGMGGMTTFFRVDPAAGCP